jgi:hypothetical protein
MVWVQKDFSDFLADRTPPWFSGRFTEDPFLRQVPFQTANLGRLSTSLYPLKGDEERQLVLLLVPIQ